MAGDAAGGAAGRSSLSEVGVANDCAVNGAVSASISSTRFLRSLLKWGAGPALTFGLILGVGAWRWGGVRPFFDFLSGQVLYFDDRVIRVVTPVSKDGEFITVAVRNVTFRPVTILGVRTTCSCLQRKPDFPMRLAPGERRELTFVAFSRDDPLETYEAYAEFYLDVESPPVALAFVDDVVASGDD